MSCVRYVVTEEATWKDPDLIRRGFNVNKGTVCGIYKTKQEAFDRIHFLLNCSLYNTYKDSAVWNGEHVEIHQPEALDLQLDIHEHNFDSEKQSFFLKM